ncbi:MAG TPA: ABC transporter ATP-binding protein [Opitutaceae bacterium]|nr:ABC transporter ATP-binding protein [Opitutaceae bacterium]
MVASPTSLNALELQRVSVAQRLRDVSLNLSHGCLAGLIGPNGSGKSTLLQAAAGLLPAEGEVRWAGRPMLKIPVMERGRMATWVPQEARFEFGFSVRSVVAQGRFAHGDDERGVDAALERFDLAGLAQRPVNQLSGGERHRVLLARAVATEAPLQLWDEPLAQLDPRHALDVVALGRELASSGKTVLLSLHDLRVAHGLDFVVVLAGGQLRAAGKPIDVLTPSLLRDVFGVQLRTGPGMILELP